MREPEEASTDGPATEIRGGSSHARRAGAHVARTRPLRVLLGGLRAGFLVALLPSAMAAEVSGSDRFDPDDTRLHELARPCLTCHAIDEGSTGLAGPSLKGVVDRRVADLDDYDYSAALYQKAAVGTIWTEATLDRYLEAPRTMAPGTTMIYAGVPDPDDRARLIAWLASGPRPLPPEAPTAAAQRYGAEVAAVLATPADAEYGEYLAGQCLTCHSVAEGASGGVPPIRGLPADYLVGALLEYREGLRANPIMRTFADTLGAREMAALAGFFARPAP